MLDAEKQVVGTHRTQKHNLQHPYAPKFPIFHKKTARNSFSASDRQLKTPRPILRVLDANRQVLERDGSRKHNLQHTFSMKKKRPRIAVFGQRLSFLASDKHLKPPPPILRLLEAKKQLLGRHRARKHNSQHTDAPTFVIFHETKRPRMAVFWSKIDFFGARQAFEDPPPILGVLDAEKQVVRAHRRRKHNLHHLYVPKLPIFHEKSAKIGRFLVKN